MNIAEAIDPPFAQDWTTPADLRSKYLDEIYGYVSRRLPIREEAEDATAETFQAAISSVHRLGRQDPRLWLLGIARRKVADVLRQKSRRREFALHEQVAGGNQPDDLAEQNEAAAAIRRIVLALPDDQREAILLQHIERLSVAEISVVMRRSPSAVNSLLQRARARAHKEGRAYFMEDPS